MDVVSEDSPQSSDIHQVGLADVLPPLLYFSDPMTVPSTQARLTLVGAFDRFAATVTPADQRLFNDTKLKDVRDAAIQIERQLRARRTQRNMARLDPFLKGVEHYSKVVEVLCNGTPFLSWVWAPVKLMLMVRYLERQHLFVCDASALLKPRVRSR